MIDQIIYSFQYKLLCRHACHHAVVNRPNASFRQLTVKSLPKLIGFYSDHVQELLNMTLGETAFLRDTAGSLERAGKHLIIWLAP